MEEVKNIDLDKVCRVCLTIKKDMRPLFGEMVSEMLMEVARIQVTVARKGPAADRTNFAQFDSSNRPTDGRTRYAFSACTK